MSLFSVHTSLTSFAKSPRALPCTRRVWKVSRAVLHTLSLSLGRARLSPRQGPSGGEVWGGRRLNMTSSCGERERCSVLWTQTTGVKPIHISTVTTSISSSSSKISLAWGIWVGGRKKKKEKLSALDSISFPPHVIFSFISFNQLVQHQVKVSRWATHSEVTFLHNLSYRTAQYQPNHGSLGTKTSDNYSSSNVPCSVSHSVCGASRGLDGKITTCLFFSLSLNLSTSFNALGESVVGVIDPTSRPLLMMSSLSRASWRTTSCDSSNKCQEYLRAEGESQTIKKMRSQRWCQATLIIWLTKLWVDKKKSQTCSLGACHLRRCGLHDLQPV